MGEAGDWLCSAAPPWYDDVACPPCDSRLRQLQAAPASLGMKGDDVRRVRASGIAAGGKSAALAATAPAAMGGSAFGGVQGIGSSSAAAAAAEAAEPVVRKSALPPGRRGPAMTKGKAKHLLLHQTACRACISTVDDCPHAEERDNADAQKEMVCIAVRCSVCCGLLIADSTIRRLCPT